MTRKGLISNGVIAGAMAALVTTLGGAAASADPFCWSYAARAVEHYDEARANNCGFSGKNWNDNRRGHFQFCEKVGQREAQTYERGRAQAIETCVANKKKGPTPKAKSPGEATWCQGWARNQVRLYNNYRKVGCILSGDNSFGGLFEYCMAAPSRRAVINRDAARIKEGNACNERRR